MPRDLGDFIYYRKISKRDLRLTSYNYIYQEPRPMCVLLSVSRVLCLGRGHQQQQIIVLAKGATRYGPSRRNNK